MSAGIYPVVHLLQIQSKVSALTVVYNILLDSVESSCPNSNLHIVTDSVEGSCPYSELLQEPGNSNKKSARRPNYCCEDSSSRLRGEYIDLYLSLT